MIQQAPYQLTNKSPKIAVGWKNEEKYNYIFAISRHGTRHLCSGSRLALKILVDHLNPSRNWKFPLNPIYTEEEKTPVSLEVLSGKSPVAHASWLNFCTD